MSFETTLYFHLIFRIAKVQYSWCALKDTTILETFLTANFYKIFTQKTFTAQLRQSGYAPARSFQEFGRFYISDNNKFFYAMMKRKEDKFKFRHGIRYLKICGEKVSSLLKKTLPTLLLRVKRTGECCLVTHRCIQRKNQTQGEKFPKILLHLCHV